MIGRLRGELVARSLPSEVMVDVGGVGYRLTVAPSTIAALGDIGSAVVVHTSMHVREDAMTLYGFATREDRDCFEALLGAHGVGPALALAILAVHRPAELRQVLSAGDLDALTLVPGVGRKTAARLMIELKSRLDGFDLDDANLAELVASGGGAGAGGRAAALAEVRAALAGLGYEAEEVRHVMRDLNGADDSPSDGARSDGVEALLRDALRLLGARR